MKALTPLETTKYSFTYNGYGQRISKTYTFSSPTQSSDYVTSRAHTYTYDLQGRVLKETIAMTYKSGSTATKSFEFLYIGSEAVGFIYTNTIGSSATYYYDRNHYGDVVAILDNSCTAVVKYSYDAYGNCVGSGSNMDLAESNPIRYRGYYYDSETKLYYLNARYYSPLWRRFISPDDTCI